jgi:hypothetical protein
MDRVCTTCEGEEECEYGFGGKTRRKETTKDLDICGRIILKLILEEYGWVAWNGLLWLRLGISGGLL